MCPDHVPTGVTHNHRRRASRQARKAAAQSGAVHREARRPLQLSSGPRQVRDVWAWNFENEFRKLNAAVASAKGGAVIGLDTEFPGCYYQEPRSSSYQEQYETLRNNVNLLQPIQFGMSVADTDGRRIGTWNFNMHFDPSTDLHVEASLAFLRAAGVDFQHHAAHGLDCQLFGQRLAGSKLFDIHEGMPQWITFSGKYDFGYALKILTGQPLPRTPADFFINLNMFCPRRFELQEKMPIGSLEDLVRMFGVERTGVAHTAGSDALATLELYFVSTMTRLQTRSLQPSGLAAPEALQQIDTSEPPQWLNPPMEADSNEDVVGSEGWVWQVDQSQVSGGASARLAMLSDRVAVDADCAAACFSS